MTGGLGACEGKEPSRTRVMEKRQARDGFTTDTYGTMRGIYAIIHRNYSLCQITAKCQGFGSKFAGKNQLCPYNSFYTGCAI